MEENESNIVPYHAELPAELSAAERYLSQIRPVWQATPLVGRVIKLLPVDPSSACQRLLNAACHDLRSKIRTIGLDLAKDVAKTFGLPTVNSDEELEDYPTARIFDLAYRSGLLTRPEWRRLHRSYEIRRDLEHEDDEYEASTGDLIYIFETAIGVVLSREPIQVIRLQDIGEVVESDAPISITQEILDDYKEAPPQRQTEILNALTFWAIDENRPELVRNNCFRVIRKIAPLSPSSTKIDIAKKLEIRIGRRPTTLETAQVAIASGSFPFIHKRQQRLLTNAFLERFNTIKPHWRQFSEHSELLDDFSSAGGFTICPIGIERVIIRWMVEAYIGVPGRSGTFGRNRAVFFSDTAVPRIEKLLRDAPPPIKGHITNISQESSVKKLVLVPEQQPRLDHLVEITSSSTITS
ncbi:MAG: hypothetical protein ABH950_04505 [Candidatus Altiarchaeota archaeon]